MAVQHARTGSNAQADQMDTILPDSCVDPTRLERATPAVQKRCSTR